MPKRVTMEDVAKQAGVSHMTVSRAINNKGGISTETRKRVLEIAKEMGFQPSGIARGLATNRTRTIGLVVPDVANPFFAKITQGAEDIAYAQDFNLFLVNTHEDAEREERVLDSLLFQQVDGVILCSSRLDPSRLLVRLRQFQHAVLINRVLELPLPGITTIEFNDKAGAEEAVRYLISKNRRHIAFIAGPNNSYSSRKRKQGYLAALQSANITIDESLIVNCFPDSQGGYKAATAILNSHSHINAIFAYNDLVAAGVLQACRENGRSIPEDIALIGIDDIPMAALLKPSITTLGINKHAIGAKAMQILIQTINSQGVTPIRSKVMQYELIIRQSTP